MNEMGLALELLGVGMVTVFLILSLVVLLGQLIIRFVNRFMPVVDKAASLKVAVAVSEINPKKIAAIVSAVNTVTDGAGKVSSIDRI